MAPTTSRLVGCGGFLLIRNHWVQLEMVFRWTEIHRCLRELSSESEYSLVVGGRVGSGRGGREQGVCVNSVLPVLRHAELILTVLIPSFFLLFPPQEYWIILNMLSSPWGFKLYLSLSASCQNSHHYRKGKPRHAFSQDEVGLNAPACKGIFLKMSSEKHSPGVCNRIPFPVPLHVSKIWIG